MTFLKKIWPLGFMSIVELILFACNYHPGTSLLGWDGLYPELNFPVNLSRNLFAIWQEYRGVGLYDGMSYASNLVHTLFLWLLALVLPQDMLRYVFIFLMHAAGVVGMYFLLKKLVKEPAVAVCGALFYGFNLGIIQLFYAPLEVFALHFACLPLLLLALFSYLKTPQLKNLALFAFLSFLATPQGFVPQIFISYLFLIFSVLGVYFLVNKKAALSTIWKIVGVILCVNAFWLLPYIYGIPQNAPVIMNAKINQMASTKIYEMNQERGNFIDVLTLKGFMLDTAEYTNNQYGYIMKEWRAYTATPLFIIPSILFALIMVYGLFVIVGTRNIGYYPFVATGLVSFFFLGNNIGGLTVLNNIFRFLLPVFNEAFRFPFTKFETLFAFSYTILLSVGLSTLLQNISQKQSQEKISLFFEKYKTFFIFKSLKIPSLFKKLSFRTWGLLGTLLLLFLYAFPVFEGHFLFDSVRVKMEPEYNTIITFLQNQPQTTRIATLPQPTFYNWQYHQNNYRGSGFLWYGIPQATLERSFDPWSNYNENYYWELSQALYSQNATALKNVFTKYQVGLILLDENLTYPFAPRTLAFEQTKNMLLRLGAKEIKHEGKVTLYSLPSYPLFAADNLPAVNAYTWSDTDTFYQMEGNYIAQNTPDFILPFRSLFSNRLQKEIPVTVGKDANRITVSTMLPPTTSHITIPSFPLFESFIPADLVYKEQTKQLLLVLQTPQVMVNNQALSGEKLSYPILTLPEHPAFPLTVAINDQEAKSITTDSSQTLGTFLVPIAQNTYVSITDKQKGTEIGVLPKDTIQEAFSKPMSISLTPGSSSFPFSVILPQTHALFSPRLANADVNNCDTLTESGTIRVAKESNSAITLSARNADACMSFYDSRAQSSQGYLLSLQTSHLFGEPLSFWAEDPSEEYSFLYTQLPTANTSSYFFIPPREKYNVGYAFHIENISTGQTPSLNQIKSLSLTPIPYNFLTHIVADTGKNLHTVTTRDLFFTHPNPSLYSVAADFSQMESPTLVLSQAFDAGWHAYMVPTDFLPLSDIFPFFLGKELTQHVKVNNWENGWTVPNTLSPNSKNQTIIIVFLPQYLEYFGFILLIIVALYFLLFLTPFLTGLAFSPNFLKKQRKKT